jgi:DNA-binding NarL/FixJ family response regulator
MSEGRLSTSVLVVDDDEGYLQLVTSVLERAGYTTVTFASGEEALAAARTERPALAILDVKLPDVSGYEVCRALKDTFGSGLPVIFVSGVRTEPFDKAAGLLLGAEDYIAKPFEAGEFLARVRRLLSPKAALQSPDGSAAALTPREREVLLLLAEGLDQAEIAERLVISPTTVSTHLQHILEKLGVHSRAQAVALAHRVGLTSLVG